MGVDISGRNPIIRGVKPTIDWDDASEKEKDAYWKKSAKWEKKNPGDYFRANWWSWRPIVGLVNELNLDIDTVSWNFNEGNGLDTQDECNILANALTEYISKETKMKEDDDKIYVVMGSWSDINGEYLSPDFTERYSDTLPAKNSILHHPIVMEDGTIAVSTHSIRLDHLNVFIAFLKECGGFRIF